MASQLHLGRTAEGESVTLPLDAATRRMAILAMSGAGKSNAAVVLAEQMYDAGIPWVAIDPKGDWYGVRSAGEGETPGLPIPIFGGRHGDLPLEPHAGKLIGELIAEQRLTCVLDVSDFDTRQQMWGFLADLGETLLRRNSHPLHLFLEEADEYIPQVAREGGNQVRCLGVWQRVVKRGRTPAGLGSTQITQRSAALNNDTLFQAEALIAMRNVGPTDLKVIASWMAYAGAAKSKEIIDTLPTLADGEAWLSSPAWLRRTERFRFERRRTFDSGATPILLDAVRPSATLADVDIEQLRLRMGETVARVEADDPKKLRVEIGRLETLVKKQQIQLATNEHLDTGAVVAGLRRDLQTTRDQLAEAQRYADEAATRLMHSEIAMEEIRRAAQTITEWTDQLGGKASANTGDRDVRSDGSDREATGSAGRARGEPAGRAVEADSRVPERGNQPARNGVGTLPVRAQPGSLGESKNRAEAKRSDRQVDRPRIPSRDTNDMKDEEVEQLIERILDRRGMVLRVEVPAAEVIRHEYQRAAVERVLSRIDALPGDDREILRFMLSKETPVSAALFVKVATGNSSGQIIKRYGDALARLLGLGAVEKAGGGGGGVPVSYRPKVRQWIESELAPHESSAAEVEEVYQAVLGRIAVAP